MNIELNGFLSLFNVWMNNQNLSPRATRRCGTGNGFGISLGIGFVWYWKVEAPCRKKSQNLWKVEAGGGLLVNTASLWCGNQGSPHFHMSTLNVLNVCKGLLQNSIYATKGSPYFPKAMNFRKISERPLTPPPAPFSEKNVAIFFQTGPNRTKFATKFFRSEITSPPFWRFSGKSWPKLAFLKQKKTQRIFLDRKWSPPHPPFGNFPEIHRFLEI